MATSLVNRERWRDLASLRQRDYYVSCFVLTCICKRCGLGWFSDFFSSHFFSHREALLGWLAGLDIHCIRRGFKLASTFLFTAHDLCVDCWAWATLSMEHGTKTRWDPDKMRKAVDVRLRMGWWYPCCMFIEMGEHGIGFLRWGRTIPGQQG